MIDFYEKNCHDFENEEENKHDYQKIFTEYTTFADTTIENGLRSKFSDQEIEDFYVSFEQNYKEYDNPQIIETLFSFVDFDKFKKNMVEYNQMKNH